MRTFAGIDLGREPVPGETTICKFRDLLEAHELAPQILSTKNDRGERDPEMHQTKKGNETRVYGDSGFQG